MRVHITQPAVADLQEIEEFISKDNVAAAGRMVEKLEVRCLLLGEYPNIGRKRDCIKPGLRTITEGNYIICYRIRNKSVGLHSQLRQHDIHDATTSSGIENEKKETNASDAYGC